MDHDPIILFLLIAISVGGDSTTNCYLFCCWHLQRGVIVANPPRDEVTVCGERINSGHRHRSRLLRASICTLCILQCSFLHCCSLVFIDVSSAVIGAAASIDGKHQQTTQRHGRRRDHSLPELWCSCRCCRWIIVDVAVKVVVVIIIVMKARMMMWWR